MPISANATITVPTVAETIAIALTFIIKIDVANAPLLLTKIKRVLALPIPKIKFLAGYIKYQLLYRYAL